MTGDEATNGRNFSVKEILTDFVLPRLESIDVKLDSKADANLVSAIQLRLETLEKQFVTRNEKHALEKRIQAGELFDSQYELARDERREMREDISALKTWRNRTAGAVAIVAAVLIPLTGIVLTHITTHL